ncbi:hypothetical protein COO60DRAFT_1691995 [Scenedesmus sp. NREL 46B-D3]|nr:hypothetical protein COO60DRAFT_1691995 [Scenedesmus sp. NREL 46B-D3]
MACARASPSGGGHFTTCSITVLEQRDGPQFIFGLDMLKRHQCVLDMSQNELRFGSCDATLTFLPEHLIPKDFKRHIEEVSKQQAEKNVAEKDADPAAPAAGSGGAGTSAAAGAGGGHGTGGGPVPMDATPAGNPDGAGAAAATPAVTRPGSGQQQQQPPQPRPQAGGGAAAAGPGLNEAAVTQLVGLGFSREMAVGALQAVNGDVDAAASMLFGM